MPSDLVQKIAIAKPCVGEAEWLALREPIMSGWLTQGPKVAEFERAFAARHGVKHAIATSSCTTALHLALAALDVGLGDEVIVPAFTWIATANVVLYCGATPVFVDVDPATYNVSPEAISRAITPKTKAIIPVHLFGLCANMDAIEAIAGDIPLLEDAACAAGAAYQGRPAGSLGRAGCFSFHPRKTITTGEGGMVTTNDDELAGRVRVLRNHGASVPEEVRHHGPQPFILPDFNMLGFNYRMTDLQGAIGVEQLLKLDELTVQRQRWATYYSERLAGISWLAVPQVPQDCVHSWQSYVCTVDETSSPCSRNELMQHLEDRGISVRPGTHAVHLLGYYRERYQLAPNDFPNALSCDRSTLAIPLHGQMSDDDYEHVVKTIIAIA